MPDTMRRASFVFVAALLAAAATGLSAQTHHHGALADAADARRLVDMPEPMRRQMLANMRDHLQALQEINGALARSEFDKASAIAERRLGMSSLDAHGADQVRRYVPESMRSIGVAMHKAASRFALEAQDASARGDVKPALGALGDVMQQCVACHATYRLH